MTELVRSLAEVPGGAEAVGRVFHAAFVDERGGARQDFLAGQLATHRDRDGFALVGAVDDGRLTGFAYGYTGQRGQWWTDRIAATAPPKVVTDWLGGHFEVVEVAVLPAARGRGIGRRLLDALCEGRPEQRALLTTWQHDHPARRLYERAGWRELAPEVLDGSALYGRLLPG